MNDNDTKVLIAGIIAIVVVLCVGIVCAYLSEKDGRVAQISMAVHQ